MEIGGVEQGQFKITDKLPVNQFLLVSRNYILKFNRLN